MPDTLKLESDWEEVKERLKENNIDLTDEDLQYDPNNADALLEHLSAKLKKDKQATKEYVESMSANKSKSG